MSKLSSTTKSFAVAILAVGFLAGLVDLIPSEPTVRDAADVNAAAIPTSLRDTVTSLVSGSAPPATILPPQADPVPVMPDTALSHTCPTTKAAADLPRGRPQQSDPPALGRRADEKGERRSHRRRGSVYRARTMLACAACRPSRYSGAYGRCTSCRRLKGRVHHPSRRRASSARLHGRSALAEPGSVLVRRVRRPL